MTYRYEHIPERTLKADLLDKYQLMGHALAKALNLLDEGDAQQVIQNYGITDVTDTEKVAKITFEVTLDHIRSDVEIIHKQDAREYLEDMLTRAIDNYIAPPCVTTDEFKDEYEDDMYVIERAIHIRVLGTEVIEK